MAPLALRWQMLPGPAAPPAPADSASGQFVLTNTSAEVLPARGWALYFDCEEGVLTGTAAAGFVFEQIAGTSYRMRPTKGFAGLEPGESTLVPVTLLGPPQNAEQAPLGPYFALDDSPASAAALADYRVAPIPERADVRTPEQTYEQNALQVPVARDELPPTLPSPKHFASRAGELHWTSMPKILAPHALHAEAVRARRMLEPYFSAQGGTAKAAAGQDGRSPAARLQLRIAAVAGENSPDAYVLQVDSEHGVTLQGNSAAGVALGLESFRQLLPISPAGRAPVTLRAIDINDAPRFAYRGLMIDVARNFQSKATVIGLLDLMARFKLNVFHFHLTDDEGWRLEIAGLPELTSIGARRGHVGTMIDRLPAAYGSGPDPSNPFGSGFYTRADYIEILKHAAALQIEVIPEIEMPGHARAAVVAMAERARRLHAAGDPEADRYLLNDRTDTSMYQSAQHYIDNVMNPALPSTYAFIAHVVDAVAALHKEARVPLRTVHVGGDELPGGAWEKSPACAALMQREHLANRDELWDYFYTHVDDLLRHRKLAVAGWEELGTRVQKVGKQDQVRPNLKLAARGFTLFVWRNIEGADDLAYRAANAGYDIVLTPANRLYIDMTPFSDPDELGQTWAGRVDLPTVFDYVPYDDNRVAPDSPEHLPGMEKLTDAGRAHIKGLEVPLFSETLNDATRLDYMLMPRMLAAAERAWAPDPEWTGETDPARAAHLHA
ncbi:MAG: family 20 glycosylhydrolase, partial [Steroidobacteraceae bacterium]